jgi:hypothetical protein
VDEQTLMRLAAFTDNKIKELASRIESLNNTVTQLNVAATAAHESTASLHEIKSEIKSMKNCIKQDMQFYTDATRSRPIIGGWKIAGIVSVILVGLNLGVLLYDRFNQDNIVENRVAAQTEMLESRLKSEMSDNAKWAVSPEGKAAKELFTTIRDKYDFDYSRFDRKAKEAFYSWIQAMRQNNKN